MIRSPEDIYSGVYFFLNLWSGLKVMTIWSSKNDHLYFIMVTILNFICPYQEIEYQKWFETIMKCNETVLDKCSLDIVLKEIV
jgi:hypothetical protein